MLNSASDSLLSDTVRAINNNNNNNHASTLLVVGVREAKNTNVADDSRHFSIENPNRYAHFGDATIWVVWLGSTRFESKFYAKISSE